MDKTKMLAALILILSSGCIFTATNFPVVKRVNPVDLYKVIQPEGNIPAACVLPETEEEDEYEPECSLEENLEKIASLPSPNHDDIPVWGVDLAEDEEDDEAPFIEFGGWDQFFAGAIYAIREMMGEGLNNNEILNNLIYGRHFLLPYEFADYEPKEEGKEVGRIIIGGREIPILAPTTPGEEEEREEEELADTIVNGEMFARLLDNEDLMRSLIHPISRIIPELEGKELKQARKLVEDIWFMAGGDDRVEMSLIPKTNALATLVSYPVIDDHLADPYHDMRCLYHFYIAGAAYALGMERASTWRLQVISCLGRSMSLKHRTEYLEYLSPLDRP